MCSGAAPIFHTRPTRTSSPPSAAAYQPSQLVNPETAIIELLPISSMAEEYALSSSSLIAASTAKLPLNPHSTSTARFWSSRPTMRLRASRVMHMRCCPRNAKMLSRCRSAMAAMTMRALAKLVVKAV